MRRIWRVLLALAAATLLALGVLPVVDRARPIVIPILQSLSWWWVVAGLVGLFLALVTRRWLTAMAMAVAVLLNMVPLNMVPLVTFAGTACDPTGPKLRVLSLNSKLGQADQEQTIEAVRKRRIDVLVLLESNSAQVSGLRQHGLSKLLPHTVDAQLKPWGGTGSIIWSRHPLQRVATTDDPAVAMGEPAAWVDVDRTRVLVRAVHTFPPVSRSWASKWTSGLAALGSWQRGHRGIPVVVLGDFNAGRGHPQFRAAARDLHEVASRPTRPTWPNDVGPTPFTTIDHILVRSMAGSDFSTVDIDGTDHRGVTASLQVCR